MTTLTQRPIVEIDEEKCDGCGDCVPACAEGAIQIINGKAKLVADKLCDGMGACLGHCPKGAITVHEREAEEYDEGAVTTHLKGLASTNALPNGQPSPGRGHTPHAEGGCPGARMMSFGPPKEAPTLAPALKSGESQPTALRQWPVQMNLVPPTAPYLQGADLLICADCVPFAYADFHREILAGKALLVGCPKLDDLNFYREKFLQIIEVAKPVSITAAVMEVPCCTGLAMIAKEAALQAEIPFHLKVIGIRGDEMK